jgi:aminocarboxymuconate-semialdehyde decarboxylase
MTFTVDIHHHILPDFFWRATNEADDPVGGITPPPWSAGGALSFLDDSSG